MPNGRTCFGFGHFDGLDEVFFPFDHAHTASAAAARCFDNHGITDFVGGFEDFGGVVGQCAVRTGNAGHARLNHGVFGGNFVAHQADGLSARADKGKAGLLDLLGEIGVFGKEAVARMDAVCAGYFCGGDDGGEY